MEHETPVEDLLDAHRARPAAPTVKGPAQDVSPAEQAAVGSAGRASAALSTSVVASLQRTAGNAAVRALIQRAVVPTEEESEPAAVRQVVGKGRGQLLDPRLRDEMEARLGDDFSDVRIHTDNSAARSAAALSARAYTVGSEVVFGADSPAPGSAEFKRTLAHELTHVTQQRQGPVDGTLTSGGISISNPSDRFEQAAVANAERVMSAPPSQAHLSGAAPGQGSSAALQREPAAADLVDDEEEEAEPEYEEAAEAETEEAGAGEDRAFEAAEAESETDFGEAGEEPIAGDEMAERAAELEEPGAGEDRVFEEAEEESEVDFEEAG